MDGVRYIKAIVICVRWRMSGAVASTRPLAVCRVPSKKAMRSCTQILQRMEFSSGQPRPLLVHWLFCTIPHVLPLLHFVSRTPPPHCHHHPRHLPSLSSRRAGIRYAVVRGPGVRSCSLAAGGGGEAALISAPGAGPGVGAAAALADCVARSGPTRPAGRRRPQPRKRKCVEGRLFVRHTHTWADGRRATRRDETNELRHLSRERRSCPDGAASSPPRTRPRRPQSSGEAPSLSHNHSDSARCP